mmetsp:Transcript_24595/g.38183  ORF Transcript_24595/g.38183 Transcript_24595/m.38183 type:complete len:154 (-) Transcript_24595:538-999(-)
MSMKDLIEQEERERKKRLMKKRMGRLDYSDNILVEIDCENLANFYERSKKEFRDLVDLFYFHGVIPKEVLEGSGEPVKQQTFDELCYIYRVLREEVGLYQELLLKRITDIEKVINSHFELIKKTLVQNFKDKLERERIKKQKEGIILSLEEQF